MNQEEILRQAAEAAKHLQNQPVPQGVPPQPVPVSVQLSVVDHGPNKLIALVIMSPTGQNVFFFEPDGAERVAEALTDAARQAKTGLEIPNFAL